VVPLVDDDPSRCHIVSPLTISSLNKTTFQSISDRSFELVKKQEVFGGNLRFDKIFKFRSFVVIL
jgi:hypothetical protein